MGEGDLDIPAFVDSVVASRTLKDSCDDDDAATLDRLWDELFDGVPEALKMKVLLRALKVSLAPLARVESGESVNQLASGGIFFQICREPRFWQFLRENLVTLSTITQKYALYILRLVVDFYSSGIIVPESQIQAIAEYLCLDPGNRPIFAARWNAFFNFYETLLEGSVHLTAPVLPKLVSFMETAPEMLPWTKILAVRSSRAADIRLRKLFFELFLGSSSPKISQILLDDLEFADSLISVATSLPMLFYTQEIDFSSAFGELLKGCVQRMILQSKDASRMIRYFFKVACQATYLVSTVFLFSGIQQACKDLDTDQRRCLGSKQLEMLRSLITTDSDHVSAWDASIPARKFIIFVAESLFLDCSVPDLSFVDIAKTVCIFGNLSVDRLQEMLSCRSDPNWLTSSLNSEMLKYLKNGPEGLLPFHFGRMLMYTSPIAADMESLEFALDRLERMSSSPYMNVGEKKRSIEILDAVLSQLRLSEKYPMSVFGKLRGLLPDLSGYCLEAMMNPEECSTIDGTSAGSLLTLADIKAIGGMLLGLYLDSDMHAAIWNVANECKIRALENRPASETSLTQYSKSTMLFIAFSLSGKLDESQSAELVQGVALDDLFFTILVKAKKGDPTVSRMIEMQFDSIQAYCQCLARGGDNSSETAALAFERAVELARDASLADVHHILKVLPLTVSSVILKPSLVLTLLSKTTTNSFKMGYAC